MSRWVYTQGGVPLPEPIEVGRDWTNPGASSTGDLGKFQYAGLRAPDGTPLDSRDAHRRYMREKGLALASDFTGTWERQAQERAKVLSGEAGHEDRKRAVAQAMEKARSRR